MDCVYGRVYRYCRTVLWNRKRQIPVVGRFFFLIEFKVFFKVIWVGSGTLKIQSWIRIRNRNKSFRIRNKSFRIRNTAKWWIIFFYLTLCASNLSHFYLRGSTKFLNTYGSNLDPNPQHWLKHVVFTCPAVSRMSSRQGSLSITVNHCLLYLSRSVQNVQQTGLTVNHCQSLSSLPVPQCPECPADMARCQSLSSLPVLQCPECPADRARCQSQSSLPVLQCPECPAGRARCQSLFAVGKHPQSSGRGSLQQQKKPWCCCCCCGF